MAFDAAQETSKLDMSTVLNRQRLAFNTDGAPDWRGRRHKLDLLIGLIVNHNDEIVDSIAADYGWRSKDATRLSEVSAVIAALKHARKHVKSWAKPERRPLEFPFGLMGARAEIRYQPKGVIGLVSPWNFPFFLTITPLASIIAAGNKCMIKPSEFTPRTSELLQRMLAKEFADDEISVILGGPETARDFSALPFDHLLFTGSTRVGKIVMAAAAKNLTPVTLELGGKSPVIFSRSADWERDTLRLMNGKLSNAGQVCIAPDYLMVAEEDREKAVNHIKKAVAKLYPTLRDNDDYTAILSNAHFGRLKSYIDDAKAKGATIIEVNPAGEDLSQQRFLKMPPMLVLDPTDDMLLMQEELFGPILPLKTYRDINETVSYINQNDRPLALFYFGRDKAERDRVLDRTTAGGVTVNDTFFHIVPDDLPFGGVGASGMGRYRGKEGFLEFSNVKAIYHQMNSEVLLPLLRPPYGKKFRAFLKSRIKI
jgi:coniferyl-aldehyde dehydrogenase